VAAMDLATKTKNRILNYNSQMFSIAREWELLAVSPLTDISRFRYRVGNHGEDEIQILTVQELTSLLNHVDSRLVPYIAIGAFAGLRDAEMKKLKWSEINLDKRQIEVKKWKSKTAQRRFVTITGKFPVKPSPPKRPTFCKKRIRLKFLDAKGSIGFRILTLRTGGKYGL
jgi:integrase